MLKLAALIATCLLAILTNLTYAQPASPKKPSEAVQKETLEALVNGMEAAGKALKSQNLQLRELRQVLAEGMDATAKQLGLQKQKIEDITGRLQSSETHKPELERLKTAHEDQTKTLEALGKAILILEKTAERNNRELRQELANLYELQGQTVGSATKLEHLSRYYFEDFSKVKPSLLPSGWEGKSLSVQKKGTQHVLQMRELGTGTVTLPPQSIQKNFYIECSFITHGYVNKQRGMEIVLQPKNGTPAISIGIVDTYPNCKILINGRSYRAPSLKVRDTNCLHVQREGKSLQVKLNGEDIHALSVDEGVISVIRLALSNARDEYGREDASSYPTVESIRIGPLAGDAK